MAANCDRPGARPLATPSQGDAHRVCYHYPGQGNLCPIAPADALVKLCFFENVEKGAYAECAFWWRRLAEERDLTIGRLQKRLRNMEKKNGRQVDRNHAVV